MDDLLANLDTAPAAVDLFSEESIAAATPAMRQYLTIRARYPKDYLLFYRMGDFFELFFDDALTAAAALNIALTQRGTHLGQPIKMCGVPTVSAENYLRRLIQANFRVVICDQLEAADKNKRLVERGVTRLITPGTITEEAILDDDSNNFLASLYPYPKSTSTTAEFALSWFDISTGSFNCLSLDLADLPAALDRLQIKELLLPEKLLHDEQIVDLLRLRQRSITALADDKFHLPSARRTIKQTYQIFDYSIYGGFADTEIISMAVLLDYINVTQQGQRYSINPPKKISAQQFLHISAEALVALDIVPGKSGEFNLFDFVNECLTLFGRRNLRNWILHPVVCASTLTARYAAIEWLLDNREHLTTIRSELAKIGDTERSMSRLLLERGSPRDLGAIKAMLETISRLQQHYQTITTAPELITQLFTNLDACADLQQQLACLADELPHSFRDGGFIAWHNSASLDKWRESIKETRSQINKLEHKYRISYRIDRLNIRHNNLIGYFIEIPHRFAEKVDDTFQHRHSTATSLRYTTLALNQLAESLSNAEQQTQEIELEIYAELIKQIAANSASINKSIEQLSILDIICGFSKLAADKQLTRPEIYHPATTDAVATKLDVTQGRHPLVEQWCQINNEVFVANDLSLSQAQPSLLLTGPNMAGKSTYLRQAALLVIIAQSGCFVPAARMQFSIVDRIMCRIGAADNIARGRSTFMVEMLETAAIIHQATSNSLIILDELGRGTSTYDGIALAWSILQHITNNIGCLTLFSTHYHELSEFAATDKRFLLCQMCCKLEADKIHLLHQVAPGAITTSYGLHVARLAGIPTSIISAAQLIHKQLLENPAATPKKLPPTQHQSANNQALIASASQYNDLKNKVKLLENIINEIAECNLEQLTPIASLQLLSQLQTKITAIAAGKEKNNMLSAEDI